MSKRRAGLADPCHYLVINLGILRDDPTEPAEFVCNLQRFVADDWIALGTCTGSWEPCYRHHVIGYMANEKTSRKPQRAVNGAGAATGQYPNPEG